MPAEPRSCSCPSKNTCAYIYSGFLFLNGKFRLKNIPVGVSCFPPDTDKTCPHYSPNRVHCTGWCSHNLEWLYGTFQAERGLRPPILPALINTSHRQSALPPYPAQPSSLTHHSLSTCVRPASGLHLSPPRASQPCPSKRATQAEKK